MAKKRNERFVKGTLPESHTAPAYWFIFKENLLLVKEEEIGVSIPAFYSIEETGWPVARKQYLGTWQEHHSYLVELSQDILLPSDMKWTGLRQAYGQLAEHFSSLAGEAIQILDWDRTHQFCGRCATPTIPSPSEYSRKCPNCGLTNYPRLSPAIIVLIQRNNQILLSRSPHFPPGMYSIQAGFVEPGESLEEAVHREIMEEVGVRLKNVRYFGSQPWPFPNSLMIGFTAQYAGGELTIDKTEIEDAAWYTADKLPNIPPRLSIARKLIDWYIKKQNIPGK